MAAGAVLTIAFGLLVGPYLVLGGAAVAPTVVSPLNPTSQAIACGYLPHLSTVAVDPLTNEVYASSSPLENGILVLNASTGSEEAFVPTNMTVQAIAVDALTDRIFVAQNHAFNMGQIDVLDGHTSATVATVPLGFGPDTLAFDEANGDVYVEGDGSTNVSVINGSTFALIANISLPSPPVGLLDMALDPANGNLYLGGAATPMNLTVVDTRNNSITGTIPIPGIGGLLESVVVNANGSLLFVDNSLWGNVTVVNTTTNDVVGTVPLGVYAWPRGMAADETSGSLYVADSQSGNVSVINMTSLQVESSTYLGGTPESLAVDAQFAKLFVTTEGANALSVVDTRTDLDLGRIDPPATYPVEFSERGLPRGTPWEVSLGACGYLQQNQGSTFTFELPNGTYQYLATNFTNLSPTDGTGYVHVRGTPLNIMITYPGAPATFLGYPVVEGYVILGLLIGVSVVVAIEMAYYSGLRLWRRR